MTGSSCDVVVDNVPNKFPAGLRVLVVDDDRICLMMLKKMMKICNYEVTICNGAKKCLSLLRENKNGYDIVLSDVHMPQMDGIELLRHIEHETDVPVIMMSGDGSDNLVMKGITRGACDYLLKPIRIEALRTIWQHVFRRHINEFKDLKSLMDVDDLDQQENVLEHDVFARL